MEIKFIASAFGKKYEEIVTIDEEEFYGCEGYQARNRLNNILDRWTESKFQSEYQILDDRFDEEYDNMPYLDWVTNQKLGWIK